MSWRQSTLGRRNEGCSFFFSNQRIKFLEPSRDLFKNSMEERQRRSHQILPRIQYSLTVKRRTNACDQASPPPCCYYGCFGCGDVRRHKQRLTLPPWPTNPLFLVASPAQQKVNMIRKSRAMYCVLWREVVDNEVHRRHQEPVLLTTACILWFRLQQQQQQQQHQLPKNQSHSHVQNNINYQCFLAVSWLHHHPVAKKRHRRIGSSKNSSILGHIYVAVVFHT